MNWMKALLIGAGLLAGCVQQPVGTMLCSDPQNKCDCQDNRARGGVVVRWRIADANVGRLLDRGVCCCNPDPDPSGFLRQQCDRTGNNPACPEAPAWLVRNVQLHIRSVSLTEDVQSIDCIITAPCLDGELTTQYCLPEGTYDLQLYADIETISKQYEQFVCSKTQTLSPPVVRRTVKAGQAVNLDGIVLGVNAPPVTLPTDQRDGGTAD